MAGVQPFLHWPFRPRHDGAGRGRTLVGKGHITTWEGEALKALPLIVEGQRPPHYGGVDRFNAQEAARKRDLTLEEVLRQLAETHGRLLAFLYIVPESYFARETRFRHRLRLDTYGHYPQHTASILAWRNERGL